MIRLQKSENIDEILTKDSTKDSAHDSNKNDAPQDAQNSVESPQDSKSPPQESAPPKLGALEQFSKEVFDALLAQNTPPLPLNYQAYFESMLSSKDLDFQKKILALIEADSGDSSHDERNISFEKSIHSAFASTRDILKCTSSIYKNLIMMNEVEKKWLIDLRANGKDGDKFMQETKNIQGSIDTQINQLKMLYAKCNKILENINTNTMYDAKFNTYNKRYFIYLVQNEQKAVEKFAHSSIIIMMSLPQAVTRYLQDQATALIIMKTIAKLLLKTSRRSDIIGYIGHGIFAMLLRHANIPSAIQASQRLIDLMHNTNVILGNREICLDLNFGISKILPNRNAEDSLNFAINALRTAEQNNTPYVIYKADAESQ